MAIDTSGTPSQSSDRATLFCNSRMAESRAVSVRSHGGGGLVQDEIQHRTHTHAFAHAYNALCLMTFLVMSDSSYLVWFGIAFAIAIGVL